MLQENVQNFYRTKSTQKNTTSLITKHFPIKAILVSIGFLAMTHMYYLKRDNLLHEVSFFADVNHDNVVSLNEWKSVYAFLGKNFDEKNYNPINDFSLGELQSYANSNK